MSHQADQKIIDFHVSSCNRMSPLQLEYAIVNVYTDMGEAEHSESLKRHLISESSGNCSVSIFKCKCYHKAFGIGEIYFACISRTHQGLLNSATIRCFDTLTYQRNTQSIRYLFKLRLYRTYEQVSKTKHETPHFITKTKYLQYDGNSYYQFFYSRILYEEIFLMSSCISREG